MLARSETFSVAEGAVAWQTPAKQVTWFVAFAEILRAARAGEGDRATDIATAMKVARIGWLT